MALKLADRGVKVRYGVVVKNESTGDYRLSHSGDWMPPHGVTRREHAEEYASYLVADSDPHVVMLVTTLVELEENEVE